jgi:hypothetical protein
MGGDDLEGDEDYLAVQAADSSDSESSVDEVAKKRKAGDEIEEERNKKSKSTRSPEQSLLEEGRQIEQMNATQQLSFLKHSLNHYNLLSKNAKIDESVFKVEQVQSSSKSSLVDRLRDSMSLNKLKNWKEIKSPRVVRMCTVAGKIAKIMKALDLTVCLSHTQLVVCISARRSVAVLKELTPLKLRMAKLFPKNGSVDDQQKLLESNPFGIAVGTPHRLTTLAESGALSFTQTELIVLDCHVSNKMYSVFTLPDTAPHCMRLLNEFVVPQLKKRKNIRIAFF